MLTHWEGRNQRRPWWWTWWARAPKYPLTFKDTDGNFLMGENSYKLHLPKGIPAENFWAVTLYDAPTAAGVDKPGQPIPSINSQGNLKYNDDGSIEK